MYYRHCLNMKPEMLTNYTQIFWIKALILPLTFYVKASSRLG